MTKKGHKKFWQRKDTSSEKVGFFPGKVGFFFPKCKPIA